MLLKRSRYGTCTVWPMGHTQPICVGVVSLVQLIMDDTVIYLPTTAMRKREGVASIIGTPSANGLLTILVSGQGGMECFGNLLYELRKDRHYRVILSYL